MLTIGLTGGIGSGKSTVSHWFESQGVPVIDADKMVHHLFKTDSWLISKLAAVFGPEIIQENGEIDRSRLGKRVFAEAGARKELETIVHPRVIEGMKRAREELRNSQAQVCVWDVPLLFETGFERYVDQVWVVWVPRDIQIERVLKRDNLELPEVEARIAAQGLLEDKCRQADVVIDNSGDVQETLRQLDEAWKKLIKHI
ncbi:dephospho-CoA kinase [Desulfosporosinus sp. PR]|uniref:dephospho-CoA kinase n=1 Tax=Candidatus Desulfosporosinus nitrosoreducens TaxID=3401928 RepID=UPI0027EB2A40|nr:dephospho-CoA kinase [Desulfosporosinus sp. PR]MDQ7095851.1 dephospho-CoA kinase [Desulfosporosinus sp. PR]